MIKKLFSSLTVFFAFCGFVCLSTFNGLMQILISIACFFISSVLIYLVFTINEKEQKQKQELVYKVQETQIDAIKKIEKKLEKMNRLPDVLSNFINTCNGYFVDLTDKQKSFIEYTSIVLEKMEETKDAELENVTKSFIEYADDIKSEFKKNIRDNKDCFDMFTDNIQNELEKLSIEYKNFQKVTDSIVSQMSSCSEKELEQLRQIFNEK